MGSAGSRDAIGSSSNFIQFTLGEPFTTTRSSANNTVTQGFHQPTPSILSVEPLFILLNYQDASCVGFADGYISIDSISGCGTNYTITIDGEIADSLVLNSLLSGNHDISISSDLGCRFDTSIYINTIGENCDVIDAYNAISPNGDGVNDTWTIVKIITEPNNSVNIYNRWGSEVWSAQGYDNKNIVWRGTTNSGKPLPDGTYFYIINLEDSGEIIKGFVEITR